MKKQIGTMTKRGFAFSLALVMCVTMLPTVSLAAEETEGGTSDPETTLVTVSESPQPAALSENSDVDDPPETSAGEDEDTNDEDGDMPNPDEGGDTDDEDGDVPENPDEGGDTDDEDSDVPDASDEDDEPDAETPSQDDDTWDITKTQRPEASETVTESIGTDEDKVNPPEGEGLPWNIFYDPDKDVYKVTFNIGEKAEGTQTIDLTKALELMNKYAEAGKKELQEAIDKKPEKGELPPVPGMPEGLDEELQSFWDEQFPGLSGENNGANTKDYVLEKMNEAGIDTDNSYVQDYAQYIVTKADNAFLNQVFETRGGVGGVDCFRYFMQWYSGYNGDGEPTDAQVAEAIAVIQSEDASITAPEYPPDESDPSYPEYAAKKAEVEEKYAEEKAAYDAAIEALQRELDRQIEANILQPGDVKKFELYLTSDSPHIYKYLPGSFTLATPEWPANPDGEFTGFDGQTLPDEYIDHNGYYITLRCEPIQEMLKQFDVIPKGDLLNRIDWGTYAYVIDPFLETFPGDDRTEQLNSYILDYYGKKYDTTYDTIDELVRNNPDARAELTKTTTSGNRWFQINYETYEVDAHTETVKYDTLYKNLFSFAFGSEEDINAFLEGAEFNDKTKRWEYQNNAWTNNGYQQALYYYMDHQEIWQETDDYFNALLDGGLSKEQATWTSLMMALNFDHWLTGNDWQDTWWPWYSSIQLERMDIDFTLSKKDQATGETITRGETEFQVYYIDKVTNEDGTETSVHMYCTYDAENNAYTFVPTPSTVWTKNGELKISYAMMKDVVYYLQEQTAPAGYEKDTNVYIVMSEDDYNQLTDEDKASLGEFDKYLDMTTSEDGLQVNADFINVKIVKPDPKPSHDPDPDPTPDPDPDPGIDIPEEDPPLADIPEEDPPLTDIPEEDPPLAEIPEEQPPLVDIPDNDVPLADVPETGDLSTSWYLALLLSACGLPTLALLKKREQEA